MNILKEIQELTRKNFDNLLKREFYENNEKLPIENQAAKEGQLFVVIKTKTLNAQNQ